MAGSSPAMTKPLALSLFYHDVIRIVAAVSRLF
jgi:hypothetical protein